MHTAVILDMDGLMLDTEAVSLRVWRDAARDLGLDLTDAIASEMVGRPEAATRELLRAWYGDRVAALVEAAQRRYRDVLDAEGVPKKPGLDALLDWLVLERIPRAVATSTARALAEYKLARVGIRSRFDVVICGDEIAHGKPAPDIFVAAARALGVEPAQCVVLEDSGPGIIGAAAAGMTPILVPDRHDPPQSVRQLAYAVVDSLEAARPLVATLVLGAGAAEPAAK